MPVSHFRSLQTLLKYNFMVKKIMEGCKMSEEDLKILWAENMNKPAVCINH